MSSLAGSSTLPSPAPTTPSSTSSHAPPFCSTRPINSSRSSNASGPASPKPTSAAASATSSAPKISTLLPKIGGKKPHLSPVPISNTSASPATLTKPPSPSSPSLPLASTAQSPPC